MDFSIIYCVLFQELKSKYGASLNTRILNDLIRLAKHSKSEAEAALNDFLEILSDERFVSCFYYLFISYVVFIDKYIKD